MANEQFSWQRVILVVRNGNIIHHIHCMAKYFLSIIKANGNGMFAREKKLTILITITMIILYNDNI